MTVLRNLLFYLLFYGGSPVFVIGTLVSRALAPDGNFREWPNAWSRYHRRLVVHVLGIEVRIEGTPIAQQALYAIKHESFYEAIDLGSLFDMPVPFGKEELYRIPGWGKAAMAYGSVPVYRDSGAKGLRAMLAAAKQFIGTGRPFCILPEGTRVPHGTRPPLRSGFAGLYKLLGLPVVPVAIDSGPTYHRVWKRRGTITIRFMETVPPGLPRDEVEARVHEAINALNP
ncbi:1-acyl-sn-glycerol-3-phosphate acyltransferase [Altererythrobacter salegens]|uniref:1-acyl-sn-glycerol-3-phosphate acyltransferase n=1 Tax=Croceibacterium salegens TaxID=1737568 RepID=A0A6I4SY94_9SPHN|nr:1-acyl-sn-glycerol-3-phosphate acyltransferase [Croceibacterium salegens]